MIQRASTPMAAERRASGKRYWVLLAVVVTCGVLAANAHLLYVALASQPGCLDSSHASDDGAGEFRAAKPAC